MWVVAVRKIVARERVYERRIDALTVEHIQQLSQIDGLFVGWHADAGCPHAPGAP